VVIYLFIYLFIYYMVYTHVKSFTFHNSEESQVWWLSALDRAKL